MNYNRKDFIRLSGKAAAAIALVPMACKLPGGTGEISIDPFGLQLYSVRDDMTKDPIPILKQLASFGYTQLESYEGPRGMFWGMSNIEFKKLMDELGMRLVASHCDIYKDFERKVDGAAAIGMKYLIYNWPSRYEPMDAYKKKAEDFNKCGETCKQAGIRFGQHNYQTSFQLLDGIFPQDYLMNNTDPGLVDYEMDFYWVVMGGQDPVHWLKKYPNRFRLCHIKDRIKGSAERDASCVLGTGSIDFPP